MDRGSLNRVDIGKELADSYRTVMRNKQYYQVIYQVADRFFERKTVIKNINRGDIFYDITKIEDITNSFTAKYGGNPQYRDLGNASIESIPAKGSNSQAKNSERETEKNYSQKTAKYSKYGIDWRHAYDRWADSFSPMSRSGYREPHQ